MLCKCRSRSKSPPVKRSRYQPAAKGRHASLSSTTTSSSSSPARGHRRYSSSFSPVKRTDRHSRHSPAHSRQRSRRSPSPRGKPRRTFSPRSKGRADRGASPLPRSRRGSPSRGRPHNRARGASPPSRPRSARSPVGRPRQRGTAPAGGSTTPCTASRSPSPYRRWPANGHPPRARVDQQKAPSSPQRQAKGAASASQPTVTTAGRRSQDRSPERSARLPAANIAEPSRNKLHGSTAVPAGIPVMAIAAKDPAALPPPPLLSAHIQSQPSTTAVQALPPPPVGHAPQQPQPGTSVAQALPPPPVGGHGMSQPQTSSAQAEQPESRARRVFADQGHASQGYTPAPAAAASNAVVTQSNVIGSTVVQQQRPAGHASRTAAAPSLTPAPVLDAPKQQQQQQPSTSAVQTEPQPADPSASAPAKAQADTPEHSFDGRQSFISLDVDDAPAGGAASVDQPSPASRQTKLVPPVLSNTTAKTVSAQLPAASQAADKAKPADGTAAAQNSQQQNRQQQAAAAAIKSAADIEADKRDIKPDLFTASRPPSAASQGAGTLKFDADQKQLPAAKSKVATKGNIQIVLATKHKQVQMLYGLAKISLCAVSSVCDTDIL